SRQQTGDETQNSRQQTGGETKNKRREEKPVIDRDKLRAIKEEQSVRKIVWPDEIAAPIKQEVYGQDAAIDTLSDAIVINRMQKKDKLLVMAFLGPPATGKSTVGRALAEVLSELYGNRYGFIEISANEYTQEHMVQKVLGAPPGYTGYGQTTVLEPVRKNQYHVILINEIEKAHEKLLVALMEAMDTGFLGMADNSPAIDLNHCILLFTSNIPIDMENYRIASEFERSELCKDAFTKHCGRSEISRRIQDFIVFVPLSEDARVDVIIKFARKALADMDAELIKIDERLMADFLKYKTKYGASELGNYVTRAIGKKMLKTRQPDLVRGKKVTVYGTVDSIEFQVS
ncbi:MAG: AAA family ATPase, partial [Eubacteriales bacterium]|nr:AAA family ATPase [Eubacteriales bacterium]